MASLTHRLKQTPAAATARSWRRALRLRGAHGGDFESRLTWIFGSPRSGSTWLLNLLAEHEGITAINEPLIGWYLGPFMCDLPTGDASELDLSNFTLRRVQRYHQDAFFADQFADVWGPGLARVIRERFYEQALRGGGRSRASRTSVVVKEPNGSQSADLIMRALPAARMLFLLRDGRDVVDSELAANLEGSWATQDFPGLRGVGETGRLGFVIQSAHKWLWRTEVVQQAFAEHAGPKHLVRYERLLEDTEGELRALFGWLGVVVSEDQLRAWTERHAFAGLDSESSGEQRFYRAARPGSWRENLRADEQAAIERVIGPKLKELGY